MMKDKKTLNAREQYAVERLEYNLARVFEWIERAGWNIKDGDYRGAIFRLGIAKDALIDAMLNNERLSDNSCLNASEYSAIAKRAVHAGVKNAKQE